MAKDKFENQGTAIWIDETGSFNLRIFKILDVKDNKALIGFGAGERYTIPFKMIRKKRVIIYKLDEENIKVQNPDNWKDVPLKENNIKELRFNLQNYAIQEDKAARSRWTLPVDILTKLSPLFKLLIICIVIGVLGWAAFKFGAIVLDLVMKSRIADCNSILPNAPIPIGVSNVSVPIG